jgi:hypothetical protein
MYLLNSKTSKFAVCRFDCNENNPSTSSHIHHLHPHGHPCSKHVQYTSPATINRYKLEMFFRHTVSVRIFSECSSITVQLSVRMAYQQDALRPRLQAVCLHSDGLQTDYSITQHKSYHQIAPVKQKNIFN